MTEEKGRGVFATKPIKRGDVIFVEKPIAIGSETFERQLPETKTSNSADYLRGSTINMAMKLSELLQLKGVEALRLNQLFDGGS